MEEERGVKIFAEAEDEPGRDSEVFFNDEMLENRDLSEIALKVFRSKVGPEEFFTCDALSASGIRGMRYVKHSDLVYMNDSNPHAVESIEKGLEENGFEARVSNRDANVLMSENRNMFHFIDVDPFGPFNYFLDSAARAANHQSFVGFTATDNAVTAGTYQKTCRRRYGSKPFKNSIMHETGLRIYIKEVFENFARYDKCFDPKICFHKRHYSRVMGRVTESKKRTNGNLDNIGHMSFCQQCHWRKLERVDECPECGETPAVAGPLWTGKLIDIRFTEDMLEEMPEDWESSHELLEKLHAEGEIMTPYYDLHALCSSMNISAPKRDPVIEAIREKGYPISRTHFSPLGFRTDAPLSDIKEIVREKHKE